MATERNSDSRPSDIPESRLTLFVVKASPTSTANSVKPLMLIEELKIPHDVYIVGSPGKEAWFSAVNPCKMIPALEDFVDEAQSHRTNIWESSSCLNFLTDKYDTSCLWSGRDLFERAQIGNYMMLHTASLGATSKWWLWLKVSHKETCATAVEKLGDSIKDQYSILERRLNEPGQEYIALADRPTIVDLVNLPFANAKIAATADWNFSDWPKLNAWSEKMLARPAVQRAFARVIKFGIEEQT